MIITAAADNLMHWKSWFYVNVQTIYFIKTIMAYLSATIDIGSITKSIGLKKLIQLNFVQ